MSETFERNVMMIPVSREMAADIEAMRPFHEAVIADCLDGFVRYGEQQALMAQMRAEGLDPMHHHPDRGDLWTIERPARVRANIRRNLAYLMPNKRPKPYRRPTQGATDGEG